MGLLSQQLLVTLAVLTVGVPTATVLLWHRVPGPTWARTSQRLALVAGCQVAAVLLAAGWVNDQYAFYVSWHDLLGTPAAVGPVVQTSATTPAGVGAVPAGQPLVPNGRVVQLVVHGRWSGLTEPVTVYLPPGYADAANRSLRYPVVEFLAGWHGGPLSWRRAMHLPSVIEAEEMAARVRPFIAVVPTTDVALPRDVECTDVPGGPHAETWLTRDVRDLVLSRFRASADPRSWGLAGYSTGGYCAAKLLLHHPRWYHAAVVMDGYFTAVRDGTTGDLWGGSKVRRHRNDPRWLVTHGVAPAVDLLAFTSKQDRESFRPTMAFLAAAPPPIRTYQLVAAAGGHNLRALSLALPEMLDWLSKHLLAPTAPVVPVRPVTTSSAQCACAPVLTPARR